MAVTSFTAVCRLRSDIGTDAARHTLSALQAGRSSPFAASARTHYARLQVLDELRQHTRRRLDHPTLIWSTDVDGDVRSYLVEILTASRAALAPVLALCVDAPTDPAASDFVERAVEYLLVRELRVGLQYANSPGRSAIEIRRAVDLRRKLAGFALGHQHDAPADRRAAFVETFGPGEVDLRETIDLREPVVAEPTGEAVAASSERVP
jgi:hypothetical protein